MNPLEGFLFGMQNALTLELLVAAFVGALAGTIVGILPGIGPVAGAAILLPITFMYEPTVGMIVVVGIYLGSQFGSSITSVLLNIPGDAQSVVATFDGYPLAQKGRAGAAIAIMIVGSFAAGILGLVVLLLTIPVVTPVALEFGPAELFALTAGGLIALARISGGSIGSGLFPMIIGVGLATIGTEPTRGADRYTFGSTDLLLGVSLATTAVGLYGVSEVFFMMRKTKSASTRPKVRLRELIPSKVEFTQAIGPWIRGTFIGYGFGLVPGPAATLSTFASYKVEKSVSKDKDQFGKGAVPGLAGPEAANSAATVGSLIPVLVLGLPFSATLALVLAAMTVQGIQPGPLLATQYPEVFWSVIASIFIANLMLVVLNVPLLSLWIRVLRTPVFVLAPVITVLGTVGVYSINNNMIDVRLMLVIGLIGVALRAFGFSLASLLVGVVLGPLIEQYLVEGLFISSGDLLYFVSSPIAITIWAIVFLVMVWGLGRTIFTGRMRRSRPIQIHPT